MPMLDGLEATKNPGAAPIRKSLIPILSLTADASEGAEERVLSAGANVYMTKPFNFDCLIASVKSLAWRGRALCRDPAIGAGEWPGGARPIANSFSHPNLTGSPARASCL